MSAPTPAPASAPLPAPDTTHQRDAQRRPDSPPDSPPPALVQQAMSTALLTVGPAHTLRQAAELMAARRVGAALVLDPDTSGLGMLTERDILHSVGRGQNPDQETVHAHTSTDVVFAAPGWTVSEAADAMSRGECRHLVVLDDREPVGVVSVRDLMRCWTGWPHRGAAIR